MKKMTGFFLIFYAMSVLGHSGTEAPSSMDLQALAGAFAWDFDADIGVEKVTDDLYVLFGVGGNVGVSVGADGVFIVDDQFPQVMPKIKAAIAGLGGQDIDFAVTTHWHFDHAEGNLTLGPEGTWLVAHENSREMMKEDRLINLVQFAYEQKAYPESAWPDITYSETMSFHLNGERIDLYHFGPAHTTGDTAVVFRGSNAVHLGDVYNNSGYPFIDADNGGSIDGVIRFCQETLDRIDTNTVVIPGHGPLSDYQGLSDYIDMLGVIRARMVKLIKEGMSLAEIIAVKPTAEYDAQMGDPTMLINRAYVSLTHRYLD